MSTNEEVLDAFFDANNGVTDDILQNEDAQRAQELVRTERIALLGELSVLDEMLRDLRHDLLHDEGAESYDPQMNERHHINVFSLRAGIAVGQATRYVDALARKAPRG